ncbi:DNA-binding protein [Haloferax sp. Atlit-19N]|uniref:DNA-binding protein n=1 Tax=Haloferax sp. Atlit-19N TaxID=2077201 RepID=UPI000E27F444|nr:DNA-binding protein [Haloferax sp. Atlit-19N]RDZ39371.1 DNA-binding protein [Haloferax sp. Atlit-19N]
MSYNNLDTLLAFLREDLEPGQDRIYYAKNISNRTDIDGKEVGYWFSRAVGLYPQWDSVEFDGLEVERYRPETKATRWRVTRLEEEVRLVADGGVRWLDLTGFQQQLVKAVIEFENEERESPYGVQVKRSLSEWYGHEVTNAQIYPNIDDLVEMDVLDREPLDRRTNAVQSTPLARQMLAGEAEHMAHVAGLELTEAVADGGEER